MQVRVNFACYYRMPKDWTPEIYTRLQMYSPRASTRRIARRLRVPHTRVWRTLHAEGMYAYHVQRVKHLGPDDFAERLEFCKWLSGSREFVRYILFTDEAQFNRDGVNNTHNSHVWADENPHDTVESNFQLRFNVNEWRAVVDDQLTGPSTWKVVLQERRTSDFCRRNCPEFLEDVPLNKRGRIYYQHDGAPPHSSREVRNFLNYRFPGRWIGRGGPHNWPARSPELSPLDYCVWGWMKELVYSVKVVTRDALLGRILDAADRIRNSQRKMRATCAVHNRATASVAAGGGIFESQL